MEQNILLAESCELLRIGLRAIFAEDQRVSHIHEATTPKGLEAYIRTHAIDLVVVNQSLITNISCLPEGKFVILTSKLDVAILKAAYERKCRGYLSENVSAELLRTVLTYREDTFLIEPSFTRYVMDGFLGDAFSALNEDLLTPREKEIIELLRQGVDRATIARTLCIAETTLKTHLKNISRKREI